MKKNVAIPIISILALIAVVFCALYFTNNAKKTGEIEKLTSTVADRDATIESLTSDVADRDATIESLTSDVADREDSIESLTSDLADRDDSIESLKADVADRDATIESLKADVEDRDASIESLKSDVAYRDASIESLKSDVADREASIDALKAEAMNQTGDQYYNGYGVARDDEIALEWYRQAAALGNAEAMNNIGNCYYHGRGVEPDYGKALEWFQKAADLGNDKAMCDVGVMYANGEGVEQDYEEALNWYQKAADLGNAVAMNNLGVIYEYGQGVEQDYEEALNWYQKAVDSGSQKAQENLERIKKLLSEPEEATVDAALPVVTKDPTDESVETGGACWFVTKYENATWATWHFVSPDGSRNLSYTDAAAVFPGLKITCGDTEVMKLENIPIDLNGWKVYCSFRNDAGVTDSKSALLTVEDKEKNAVTCFGTAEGKFGEVVVQVVADEKNIYSVEILKQNETLGIGSIAVAKLPDAIVAANSYNVDGVAGATVTSTAIREAVKMALESAGFDPEAYTAGSRAEGNFSVQKTDTDDSKETNIVKYTPGTYTAEAVGMGKLTVHVTVDTNSITDIKIDGPWETPGIGAEAIEPLGAQVMTAQSAEIDGVTGATLTSSAVRTAVEEALQKAAA